ncbi:MAG: hypothetical protein CMG64_03035 [Candidatus Marinimicrobia bacterium]|nr:hypothetical protein [Candidatus Neomarinimicrobiota bacterium]
MRLYIYILIISNLIFGQLVWWTHSELEWKTIETEHFKIHFYDKTERSAREAAEIAEYVYPHITKVYDFIPENKTDIVIKDVDDYSNGSAYYYDNMIEIWAKPLDYDLRGSHRWMQDVISHEFTHIIQLGKSMKFSRSFPGSYIQMLSYEKEKRDDVLYGYPNQITSYPIPNTAVPPWFAEGTAQHTYDEIFFDYWDSIRDMLLRDKFYYNSLLTMDEMNFFGKCGIDNELVYNQGYSLVEFIVDQYGEESLKEISESLSNPFNYSVSYAIKDVIGIDSYQLYEQWKAFTNEDYALKIKNIRDLNNYKIIESEGTSNINPIWSPDNKNIAFLSNKSNDYFTQTDLFIYNLEKEESEKIMSGVKSTPTWINDSLIVYTKRSKPDKYGSKYFDLYLYDFKTEEEDRLSEGSRLFSPMYDKENDCIVAINTFDGTNNIVISDTTFKNFNQITNFKNGLQIFSITKYNDNYLVDAVLNHGRDLYLIDSKTGESSIFNGAKWDIRDPKNMNDTFVYSDDRYGIYNLYYKNSNNEGYITNVVGGAFKPHISSDGRIVFSIYQDGGYKIAILNDVIFIDSPGYALLDNEDYYKRETSILLDRQNESLASDYVDSMTGPFFMPRITYDYNTIKPGLYFYDIHSLRHIAIFGGGSINSNKDLDLFLLFDYHKNKNSYFFNFYWLTRNTSRLQYYRRSNGLSLDNITYDVDYSYYLFSSDMGTRFPKKNGGKFSIFHTYSHQRQFFDVIQTQVLPDEYIEDFLFENEANYVFYDGAYDAFKGHALTLKYEHDGRKKDFLYRMNPKRGIKINNLSLSYEWNKFFEGYKVNSDTESIVPDLTNHNTFRFMTDISGYSMFKLNEEDKEISVSYNLQYNTMSNMDTDDFFYFFGGGLPGIKGYTFFDPILQGPTTTIFTNQIRFPVFSGKAIGQSSFYINSFSISLIHQMGRAQNGIIASKATIATAAANLDEFLSTEMIIGSEQIDALDRANLIPDYLEDLIYVDIYKEYDKYKLENFDAEELEEFYNNAETMRSLKKRYNSFKRSIGIEFRLLAFSFYSFPTAITYEYHIPVSDPFTKSGRQYLRILFDF